MFKTISSDAIDQVQSAKKQFVSTFVQNEQLAAIFNNFVDVQAEYTKSAANLAIDSITAFGKLVMSPDMYTMQAYKK
jgi:hypothetical protein